MIHDYNKPEEKFNNNYTSFKTDQPNTKMRLGHRNIKRDFSRFSDLIKKIVVWVRHKFSNSSPSKPLPINSDNKPPTPLDSDINSKDEKGRTRLHYATMCPDIKTLNNLFEKGADPNITDHDGNSPLGFATLLGKETLVQELIDHKANVNIGYGSPNLTPLLLAASIGNLEIIKLLLKSGAKVNYISERGYTPDMEAQAYGYPEIAKILQKDLDSEHRALLDHKLLTHRFGLDIKVEYQQQLVDLSGFSTSQTFSTLLESISSTRSWIEQAPLNWTDEDTLEVLKTITRSCSLLNETCGTLEDKINATLKAYHAGEVIVLPTNCVGHSNTVILYENYLFKGDRNFSAKCDDGVTRGGFFMYEMESPQNLDSAIRTLFDQERNVDDHIKYLGITLDSLLGLKCLLISPHKPQHGQVCTWSSSAKLGFQGAIFGQLLKKGMSPIDAEKYSSTMYRAWSNQDKISAMENYLKNVPKTDAKTMVLACIYKNLVEKKERKQQPDPVMALIEKDAPEAVLLAKRIEIKERAAEVLK